MIKTIILMIIIPTSALASDLATIARDGVNGTRSTGKCWRYVKQALFKAGVVKSYPKTTFARDAAWDLETNHGFNRLHCSVQSAPVGSVLVFNSGRFGHVEIKTGRNQFASDFIHSGNIKGNLFAVLKK